MAEHHEPVPKHPIAPKVRQGGVTPHIGPSIEDYKKVHAQTIGAQSDEWWGTVSRTLHLASFSSVFRFFFFLLEYIKFVLMIFIITFQIFKLSPERKRAERAQNKREGNKEKY